MMVPPKNRGGFSTTLPENRQFSAYVFRNVCFLYCVVKLCLPLSSKGIVANVDQSIWTATPEEREKKHKDRAER